MLILFTILTNYKEINASCYSRDFKTLNKVEDTYPNLIISAKCEIIADDCFKNMISLLSFTFEDNPNLTTIGGYSFNGCINLTNINLSSCIKLKTVKYNAFDGCKNAAYILLPKGIIDIQSSAFASNYVMTNLTIPASVEKIGNCAFMYCLKLKTLIFEDGSNLTSLSRYVFYACDFHTFEIPENVSKVHGMLFSDGWLSNITVNPKNPFLKVVNKTVFSANMNILYYFCKKPTPTFEIPSYVTTLEASLFQEGTISSITFPNTLTTIGNDCFHDSRITSIVIPENIKIIRGQAFFSCDYLVNATFLGTLDFVGNQIFSYCKKLELIVFPNTSMFLDAFALSSNDSPKICMNFTHKTLFARYTIQRVTNISVSYMNIPNIVIDKNALITDSEQSTVYDWWGYNYNEIAIPKTVTKIRERVFENSTIYKINFEEGSQLSQIYNYAFMNCSKIYSFNFSSTSLSIIGMFSFKDCINLSRVIFPSTNFQIMNNVFENCINLTNVINITNISDSCFSGCYRLCNVEIREGSEIIGVRAFDHCNSLESINIPSSVKIISDYAFINCDKLKSINFTEINNLENFSINSISNCQSLSNISRFSSDKYICDYNTIYYKNNSDSKQYLIYHLSHSQDIVVFIKCNTICQYSFNHSNNIENISISNNSVSLIESFSFNKCLNLKYINFPLSVELVSRFAFHECKSIRCPIIDNRSPDFIRMISNSGISKTLMISCHIVHVTHKVQNLERICNHSLKLKIFMRNLINKC